MSSHHGHPHGRLLSPEEIRVQFFAKRMSAQWVRRYVAPNKKIRLGHSTVAWLETDVVAWIDERRSGRR